MIENPKSAWDTNVTLLSKENPESARDSNVTVHWKRILKVCEIATQQSTEREF